MRSVDSLETYAYEANKYLVSEKKETRYNNIIKRYKK